MRLSRLGGGPTEDCGGGPTELSEVGRSFGSEILIVISSIRPGLMLLRPMPPLNMMALLARCRCSLVHEARRAASESEFAVHERANEPASESEWRRACRKCRQHSAGEEKVGEEQANK